jgi:hypothetical protein
VRIGRSALDESAIRLIEEYNPDVEFDWTRILKGQDAPVEQRPAPQDRRGKPRSREFPPRAHGASEGHVERPTQPPVPAAFEPDAQVSPVRSADPFENVPDTGVSDDETIGIAEIAEVATDHEGGAAGTVDEAAIDELLSDLPPVGSVQATPPDEAATAAQARLGSEALSRLRARHAEVLARISETVTDPIRRDQLKSQAERLNPDTWVTDQEVTEGLEQYETVFESLRTVVGRRRKRRRRSRPHVAGQATDPAPGQHVSSSDAAGGEEDGEHGTGDEL